jgi:hypothetical protein
MSFGEVSRGHEVADFVLIGILATVVAAQDFRKVASASGGQITMRHYRLSQIAMAVLGALLLIFGTKTLVNIVFEEREPEKPGYEVAGAKHEEKAGEKPAAAASDLPALLAKADAARGPRRSDPASPSQSRSEERRSCRSRVQSLPQLRQGRPEPDRPQSLWSRRTQDRVG